MRCGLSVTVVETQGRTIPTAVYRVQDDLAFSCSCLQSSVSESLRAQESGEGEAEAEMASSEWTVQAGAAVQKWATGRNTGTGQGK